MPACQMLKRSVPPDGFAYVREWSGGTFSLGSIDAMDDLVKRVKGFLHANLADRHGAANSMVLLPALWLKRQGQNRSLAAHSVQGQYAAPNRSSPTGNISPYLNLLKTLAWPKSNCHGKAAYCPNQVNRIYLQNIVAKK